MVAILSSTRKQTEEMTVEQTPLPVRAGQRSREENLNIIDRIREVTRAPDHVIKEAIQACIRSDGTLKEEDVVTAIIGDDVITSTDNSNKISQTKIKTTDVGVSQTQSPNSSSQSSSGHKQSQTSLQSGEFIDLTRDTQGILGGQISREEQDISRVLEASLAESKGSTKRKRGELWFIDPLNPHERKRQEGWPVGLKNVGNTCWFSAVIQSLFHIPKFRDIVLKYQTRPSHENEIGRNFRFVSELRQLFALLVGSERKYVDPIKAVDILKEASSTAVLDGQQQDVSEFQHKLLDWLEDAFSASENTGGDQNSQNPVHQLFQGKYKAEGFHEGKPFSQEVTFGQYPLSVLGFRDIHESLEATTAQGEIETVSGDTNQKSGQEIWFTHLPEVLTFELSRFGFNQQLNRAEKIHQQLMFPPVIYLDRYLECNKTITRQKREEARKLKDELSSLQARLDKFLNYGSSNKRYPLPDVLQCALEFAESSPLLQSLSHLPADEDMETHSSSSRASQDVSVTHSVQFCSSSPNEDSPATSSSFTFTSSSVSLTTASSVNVDSPTYLSSSPATSVVTDRMPPSILHQLPCPSSVPEAKKFKDSSVQVEFTAALMPSPAFQPTMNVSLSNCMSTSHPCMLQLHPSSSSCSTSEDQKSLSRHDPHPRSVTSEELKVLQVCLQRWREEVETDVRELQRNIAGLVAKLDRMYSDDSMKKFPYHLHAVLVHEGQAVSGHYWAFIYDDLRATWLKFNDITVSESSEEEMHRESIGGYHKASAYCLMYLDRSQLAVSQGSTSTVAKTQDLIASLPADLQQIVMDDNALFRQEILLWDEEQRNKSVTAAASTPPAQHAAGNTATSVSSMMSSSASLSSSVTSPQTLAHWRASAEHWSESQVTGQPRGRSASDDQEVVCTGEQRAGEASIIRPLNSTCSKLASDHAHLSLQSTLSAVMSITQKLNTLLKPLDIVTKATESEYRRLEGLSRTLQSKLPSEDPRLGHIVLYLMSCYADKSTIKVVLYEQFSLCALLDTTPLLKEVRQLAHELYKQSYHMLGPDGVKCYEFWHRRYYHYRQAVHMFCEGVDAYHRDRFQEALPYLNQAWLHNQQPSVLANNVAASGINPRMLAYFRRTSLQRLNELTLSSFKRDANITDALTAMSNLILPSLHQIAASDLPQDVAALEEVRGCWCQLLETDLTEEKIQRLQDFLSRMFEGGGGLREEKLRHIKASHQGSLPLQDKYLAVMRSLKECGELHVWSDQS